MSWSKSLRKFAGHRLQRLAFWRRSRPAPATDLLTTRLEVKPPAMWGQAEPVWRTFWHWLRADDVEEISHSRIELAREDFCQALSDLETVEAGDLRHRARHARSLRELWHLRPELYHLIACRHSQREAEKRMAMVNQHFPVEATPSRLPPPFDEQGRDHHA